jgi:hypothetical protein
LELIKSHCLVDENDCWLWQAGKTTNGYGLIYNPGGDRYLHRVVCALAYGPAKKGYYALHACDVRNCANPKHLRWGTAKENVADMYARNRANVGNRPKGSKNHASKFTAQTIIELYCLRTQGWKLRELSNLYDVSITAVSQILNKKHWKELYS